jgi:hypothetical protein
MFVERGNMLIPSQILLSLGARGPLREDNGAFNQRLRTLSACINAEKRAHALKSTDPEIQMSSSS